MNKEDIVWMRVKNKKTQNEFAKLIGVSLRTIQNWESGSVIPKSKLDLLNKINNNKLNIDDVTNFEKQIVKEYKVPDEVPYVVSEPVSQYNDIESTKGIPLIPIEAMAGYGGGDMQIMEFDSERFVIPTFKGADFLIQIKGSSMYPKYSSGDIVACKKLMRDDVFFQWNKVYVIDTEQGALIKRIDIGPDDDHILIVSDNEKYKPFPLLKTKINAISIVMGVIRLE